MANYPCKNFFTTCR